MSKPMTKSELINQIAEHSELKRSDVKGVMEKLATIGYKELKKNGSFLVPGFAKFVVIKKPATKERAGVNPFTKEPTVFKARPARKIIRARPVKAAKDAVRVAPPSPKRSPLISRQGAQQLVVGEVRKSSRSPVLNSRRAVGSPSRGKAVMHRQLTAGAAGPGRGTLPTRHRPGRHARRWGMRTVPRRTLGSRAPRPACQSHARTAPRMDRRAFFFSPSSRSVARRDSLATGRQDRCASNLPALTGILRDADVARRRHRKWRWKGSCSTLARAKAAANYIDDVKDLAVRIAPHQYTDGEVGIAAGIGCNGQIPRADKFRYSGITRLIRLLNHSRLNNPPSRAVGRCWS